MGIVYTEILRNMREKLAEQDHKNWSQQMRYLFVKGKFNKNGTFTINKETVEKYIRLIELDYSDISEEDQKNRIQFADKNLDVLRNLFVEINKLENFV